jgi:hypothetical protein
MSVDIAKAERQLRELLFWDGVAEVYDTHGLPKDIIRLKLRKAGLQFDEGQFDRLLDYMVGRRNKSVEILPWDVLADEWLIPLPEGFVSEKWLAEIGMGFLCEA